MTTRESCHFLGTLDHCGKRPWAAAILVFLALSCAGVPGPRVERPRIVRRQVHTEMVEGLTRTQVEDRVGPLLLREIFGEQAVYVEPQTRCYYIFVRDLLRDWSCS